MQLGDHFQTYDSFWLFSITLKINLLILDFSSYIQLITIYYMIQNGTSIHTSYCFSFVMTVNSVSLDTRNSRMIIIDCLWGLFGWLPKNFKI